MAQNDVNIKIQVDATQANQSTENYKARLKQLKDEMTRLQVETDGLSKASAAQRQRFAQLSAEAGKIQDAMSDTAQQVKNLSDDYRGMSAALQGVQGAVGGITAVSGAMSALGIDSEGASESIKKITSLMGILQGVQQVQKTLNKDSALMTALMTAKNKLLTTSIQQQTTAQLALNAAKLGMVGAITAVVAALTVLIAKYASAKNEAAELAKTIDSNVAESLSKIIPKVNKLKDEFNELGDNLNAKKKYYEDHKKEILEIDSALDTYDKFENAIIKNTDKYIEAQKLRARAEAARALAVENTKEMLEEELKNERLFGDGQRTFWEEVALKPLEWIKGKDAVAKAGKEIGDQIQADGKKNIDYLNNIATEAEKSANKLLKSLGLDGGSDTSPKLETPKKQIVEIKEAYEDYDEVMENLAKSIPNLTEKEKKHQEQIEFWKPLISSTEELVGDALARIDEEEEEHFKREEARQKQLQKIREAKWAAASMLVTAYSDLVNTAMEAELEAAEGNEVEQQRIRKKYARSKFLAQIGSIGISTAQAIMEAWSSVAAIMFPGNVIAGGALTAMLAATGIAQTMKARAEMDNALKAARGGILEGPSHEQGGIMLSNGIEAEGGEAIINKRSTAAFAPLLSQINSFNGYGAPLIQSTPANNGILGSGISETTIQKIVAATVAGVASIPVVVSEHAITETQRIVGITKERAFI